MIAGPRPLEVELEPYSRDWATRAEDEARALAIALGPVLLRVHHVGSTAVPGMSAKPIVDLMPVVTGLAELETLRSSVERLGYAWWGGLGLPGRRYCSKADPRSGRRLAQLHCYAAGSPEIRRHLAFRDCLRDDPKLAAVYEAEKRRCRTLHPDDSHAYGDCKSAWIRRIEFEALARLNADWSEPAPLAF